MWNITWENAAKSRSRNPDLVWVKHEPPRDKTKNVAVRPAKTQISLGIHPVWSESSLCTQWVAKGPSFLHANREGSDQTGRMPRLTWVFAGRTCHFVGFVTRRLIYIPSSLIWRWWHLAHFQPYLPTGVMIMTWKRILQNLKLCSWLLNIQQTK